jgi:hypothetical protein
VGGGRVVRTRGECGKDLTQLGEHKRSGFVIIVRYCADYYDIGVFDAVFAAVFDLEKFIATGVPSGRRMNRKLNKGEVNVLPEEVDIELVDSCALTALFFLPN